jgi:anthranilate/para-aminobenzoate synthase component I
MSDRRQTDDPVATYRALRDAGELGDYSYLHLAPNGAEIGWNPIAILDATKERKDPRELVLDFARQAELMRRKAFGYVAFDAIDSTIGRLPDRSPGRFPLIQFMIPGDVLSFRSGRTDYVTRTPGLDIHALLTPAPDRAPRPRVEVPPAPPVAEFSAESFLNAVAEATRRLGKGTAQKTVLSRFRAFDIGYDPIDLFETYCLNQPFVDAFLVSFGDVVAIIASPELLVDVQGGLFTTNPLAGTRPRGATPEQDIELCRELRYDHKEIAEHVLSVTTMLGELGPLCEPSSLVVNPLMEICRQRKVQHLSSTITGRLARGVPASATLWGMFPSVTVAGLEKSVSIPMLRELEGFPRGLYSGAVGWVTGDRDCRFSLAIRGVFRYAGRTFVHAGAGIMQESVPERELAEVAHKLAAMSEALEAVATTTSAPWKIAR